jgi:hypothetical protein
MKNYFWTSLVALLWANSSFAADRTPTFFLKLGGGFYSYESEFVNSNDNAYSSSYSLGVNAGSSKNLSMLISNSTLDTTFSLNTSKSTLIFQDTSFKYFWGPVYLGASLSQVTAVITRTNSTETAIDLDAIGTGFGVNFGMSLPMGKASEIYLDGSSTTISTIKEVNKAVFLIGPRTDISIGGVFPITKSLISSYAGVNYRSFTLSLDGVASTETVMMTEFGFSMNHSF